MPASLLDRYSALQSRPLGTSTALSASSQDEGNPYGQLSSAGKQYRQLEGSYGRALRILNHAARRGDAKAALTAIDVRKQAMADGLSPGGIRRSAESDAGINSMVISKRRAQEDIAAANSAERLRGAESLTDMPPEPTPRENVGYNPGGIPSEEEVTSTILRPRKWWQIR